MVLGPPTALTYGRRGSIVEELPLMLGSILMLVAAIGIVLYVALVIAIPVCRMLDWFSREPKDARKPSSHTPNLVRLTLQRITGHRRTDHSTDECNQ